MNNNVIPFRVPAPPPEDLPLEGIERLRARRLYREVCKAIAPEVMAKAFSAASKFPATRKLGVSDAYPLFVAAMRRELRKSGLF